MGVRRGGVVVQARSPAWVERLVIGTMIALVVLDAAGSQESGLIAGVAATTAIALTATAAP